MPTEPVTVRFTLTRAEVTKAVRAGALRQRSVQAAILFFAVWLALVLAVDASMFWQPILFIVVFLGLLLVAVPASRWRSSPQLRSEQVHTYSEDGIATKVLAGESRVEWRFFDAVRETPDAFFLVQRRRRFQIIPKRAFASAADMAEFRRMAARLGPEAPPGTG